MPPICLLPPRDSSGVSKRCKAYAQLYSEEIEDFFRINFVHCYSFERFFDSGVFESLIRREMLPLEIARLSTTDDAAFEMMDKLITEKDEALAWLIHLRPVHDTPAYSTFVQHFFRPCPPFLVLDRVASVLDVEPILDTVCPGPRYPELRAAVSNGSKDRIPMARRFLRTLPLLGDDKWFWSLIEACTQDAYNISKTLPYLMSDWKEQLAERRASAADSFSMSSLQRVLMVGVSCRPPADFEPFRDEMTVPGTSTMPVLREYQKELVQRTDRGENTVVCAPTGSGKTVVAAHIALHHLKTRAKQGKPARVVMVDPKVMLVDQQSKLFKEYTKKEFYVAKLSGDTTVTGEAQLLTFLSGDIVVVTPQILVNMLQDPAEKTRLYVADISLLLLDECHHTDKKNPYNVIMRAVKEANHEKPQVVGLTASLGVGDGSIVTEDQATNHIVRMCLRMAARSVATVIQNKAELARHVQLPEDVIRRVHHPDSPTRRFHAHLQSSMNFVIRNIFAEIDLLMMEKAPDIDFTKLARFPPVERTEEFTQAYVNMDTELRKLTDGERKWRLKRGIQFVKLYHSAMLLNDLLPASYAFEQLCTEVDELETEARGHKACAFLNHFITERSALSVSVHSEEEKEILLELKRELSNQFKWLPDESRVLIFCLRRETARLLVKYLNDQRIQGMGRAEVLTSTNAASVRNGQSSSEQRAVIEAFMRGTCKVIVSTSVAEEGLDVAACNLIIKYNTTGNVISLVQQRGRARASNARSVLLALDERVYQKEFQNKRAEEIMSRTVESIDQMGDAAFLQLLAIEAAKQKTQEEADEKEAEKRRANKYRELSVLCEKCNHPICSSSSLRLFHNHYISVDSGLWRKMRVQAKKGMVVDDTLLVAGVVKCPCEKEIGRLVKIDGQFVPTLKAEAMLFRAPDGKLLQKMKKWKGIAANLLEIREGTALEATAMNRALQASNVTLTRALANLGLL